MSRSEQSRLKSLVIHPRANEIWEFHGREGEPEFWKWTKLIYILSCSSSPHGGKHIIYLDLKYLNERGVIHEESMHEYLFSANFGFKTNVS